MSCLLVTLQCTRDGQFVVVVARDATLPRLDVESVMLLEANEASCSPVATTSAFAVYQFPVTDCGTTLTVGVGTAYWFTCEFHLSGVGTPCGLLERAGFSTDRCKNQPELKIIWFFGVYGKCVIGVLCHAAGREVVRPFRLCSQSLSAGKW